MTEGIKSQYLVQANKLNAEPNVDIYIRTHMYMCLYTEVCILLTARLIYHVSIRIRILTSQ